MDKSLSMILANGGNIISISEFYGIKQERKYLLLVTSPEKTDTHIRIVINRSNVETLIGMLQEIIKESEPGRE